MMEIAAQLLTGVALIATLVARWGMRGIARRSTVALRLRTIYSLIAALLFLRLLATIWDSAALISLLMSVAAWLPFQVLRLSEQLVRRHAPRMLKFAALAGSLGFSVVAVTLGYFWSMPAIISLALFQAAMLLFVVVHLWQNWGEVSASEKLSAQLFAWVLFCALPLTLTDFRAIFPDLPVRGGVFAVLFLLLVTSRLVIGQARRRMLIIDVLTALGGGSLMAAGLWLSQVVSDETALVFGGFATTVTALVMLIERFAANADEESGLLSALANVSADADQAGLIAAHSLLANGLIVEAGQLADIPQESLERLAQQPIISGETHSAGALLADAAKELLERYSASHLLRLCQSPPRFLAVSTGGWSDARLEDELIIIARLLEAAGK
jgi:hypothetical protein